MRAVKAKLNRRKAEAASRRESSGFASRMASIGLQKGGLGKSIVLSAVARDMAKPKGTWKEYWPRLIRNISESNRLPRGFREPVAALMFGVQDSTRPTLHGFRK